VARIVNGLRFALAEFGPLIAFLLLSWSFGVKAAIAGTVTFVSLDGARRLWTSVPLTRIYVLTSAVTAVFGAGLPRADFMLKYEAAITNVATGVAFVVGAYGKTPLLHEIAEQHQGAPFPDRKDVRRFFELFTLVWAGYFFLNTAVDAGAGFTLSRRRPEHGGHAGGEHHPGASAFLPVRPARAPARERDADRRCGLRPAEAAPVSRRLRMGVRSADPRSTKLII
jgi:hypothetical protein